VLARQANGASKNSIMIQELMQPSSSVLAMDCPFPEALAIIEGNNPGWVFADGLNTPRAALVWAQGIKGFYLVGDAHSAVFPNPDKPEPKRLQLAVNKMNDYSRSNPITD
jgi:hypothetical protein